METRSDRRVQNMACRCYLEMGWMYEAEDVLQKINNDGLPSKLNNWFSTVNADFLIRNGEYKQAIPYLQTAIKAESKKAQKIRMNFLLAPTLCFD